MNKIEFDEVTDVIGAESANKLLKKGWKLIATHAIFTDSKGSDVIYVFGRTKTESK